MDPRTGENMRMAPLIPPAPILRFGVGPWQTAVPATTVLRTTPGDDGPHEMEDDNEQLRQYAKPYYARFGELDDDMLRIAVSTKFPLKSFFYTRAARLWKAYSLDYQHEWIASGTKTVEESNTANEAGASQDKKKRPARWFPRYVQRIVEVHDYHIWLDNMAIKMTRTRIESDIAAANVATGDAAAANAAADLRRIADAYEDLYRGAVSQYEDVLVKQLKATEDAVLTETRPVARLNAEIWLKWVREWYDEGMASARADRPTEGLQNLPTSLPFYKDFKPKECHDFWLKETAFNKEVARCWLSFLEPEVNVKATLEKSPRFWELTRIRWFVAADTLWTHAFAPALEKKRCDSFDINKRVSATWKLPDLSTTAYQKIRTFSCKTEEEIKKIGHIDIIYVPAAAPKRRSAVVEAEDKDLDDQTAAFRADLGFLWS